MDKEKEWSLIIEQANIQMKLALKGAVVDTVEKEVIKANVRKLIDDTKSSLKLKEAPKDLIDKVEKTMMLRFVDWYTFITAELLKGAKASKNPLLFKKYQDITGEKLKPSKGMNLNIDGYDIGSIDNVEDYVTTGRTAGAQNFIDDYVDKVKKAMHTIADKNLVMRDRLGRKLSLRNLAEMTARFEQQQEKLQKLKDEGIEYVVASSHSNASERCQIWQGKVFIIDCEVGATFKQTVDLSYRPTALGKIDGIDYYSLKDAMLHGFLGYNCRHRLVKYTKGMDLFNEYDAHTIATERSLEAKQRYLERKIREMKQKAVLAIDPKERKKYTLQSKKYQEIYATYCHNKGLVRYDWRTRITKVERSINVDYGEVVSDFRIKEEISYNIRPNTRNFVLEEKIIDFVGKSNPIPKLMVEKLGIDPKAKIVFREPTVQREGSAEHIVLNHRLELEHNVQDYVNYIKKTIKNPSDVMVQKNGRIALTIDRKKSDEKYDYKFIVVIEKIDESIDFEIVSCHRNTLSRKKKS